MAPARIDHLVVAAHNLHQGSRYVFERLGVMPREGGEHVSQGTHNMVLRLAVDCYLEIIAVNPRAARPAHPRWFELDSELMQEKLRESPKLITWAVRTNSIDELAVRSSLPLGSIEAMSRGDLRWRLTMSPDGRLNGSGIIPFLIQWDSEPHPASTMPDSGCSLVQLTARHPEPGFIQEVMRSLGADKLISIQSLCGDDAPCLTASIRTPLGLRELG